MGHANDQRAGSLWCHPFPRRWTAQLDGRLGLPGLECHRSNPDHYCIGPTAAGHVGRAIQDQAGNQTVGPLPRPGGSIDRTFRDHVHYRVGRPFCLESPGSERPLAGWFDIGILLPDVRPMGDELEPILFNHRPHPGGTQPRSNEQRSLHACSASGLPGRFSIRLGGPNSPDFVVGLYSSPAYEPVDHRSHKIGRFNFTTGIARLYRIFRFCSLPAIPRDLVRRVI
jgi:hypothetical protein